MIRTCPLCGSPVTSPVTGRPRRYCTDACRRFDYYLRALEALAARITFARRESASAVRSRLWTLRNKGVPPLRGTPRVRGKFARLQDAEDVALDHAVNLDKNFESGGVHDATS